jgi:hypothetical protein
VLMSNDLDFHPNASILKYLGEFDDYFSCNVGLNFVLLECYFSVTGPGQA